MVKFYQRRNERINQRGSNGIKTQGMTMNIDFEKEIGSITAQIIEKYKPEKIILFGSAVNGKLGSDSDVDLLIIKKDTPLYGADRIRELSRIINRNIPVDFLVYRPEEFQKRLEMGDPFLKAVLKEGKVLYG
jgi:predicted nucleotidyltransferase